MAALKTKHTALLAGILSAAALRTAMAPYPNIEPVMLFTLTAGLTGGPLAGFIMGAGTMALSNIMMTAGPLTFPWILQMPLVTVYTSVSYGLVGVLAGIAGVFKKASAALNTQHFAAALTVFYDLITCIAFALQFYGPAGIPTALTMQVPFTALHLSNAVIVFIFAPMLHNAALKAATGTGAYALQCKETKCKAEQG